MKKKAQAWGIDLTVAALLFTVGIFTFFIYTINQPSQGKEVLNDLFYDGKIISDSILSKGFPSSWNSSNVITIGILTQGEINKTKAEYFYNLSIEDYNKTKNLFNTKYEYYFFLDKNITLPTLSKEIEGIGKKPSNSENLIKITRLTIYEKKPSTMNLYIWN
jgi:hypothetical protein